MATNSSNNVGDKVIGIIVILLSVCGVLFGAAVMAGLGIIAAAIGSSGASAPAGSADAAAAGAAAGLFGMAGAVLGGVVIVMSLVSVVIGFGISKSAKWGFWLGALWYGLWSIVNVLGFNLVGLVVSGLLLTYCILRLTGNVGPRPA
jgi:hypothetical protein